MWINQDVSIKWVLLSRPELEACYHFTEFAVTLNEMEVGVAPTDSRFRPDQRYMEQARWDDANVVKVQLEDKQRTARRKLEQETTSAAEQGQIYRSKSHPNSNPNRNPDPN